MAKTSSKKRKGDGDADVEIRVEIGRRIAARRKALRVSAETLAKALGITRTAVTHLETGRNNVKASLLWKCATLLACEVGHFFPEVPEGFALTVLDAAKVEQEAGEKAVNWARTLFPHPKS